jgi:hypothetical protein
VSRNEGSLYARIALDRPHGLAIGLARVRNLTIRGVRATLNATLFGGQANAAIGVNGVARIESALGTASAQTRVVSKAGALEGGVFGRLGDEAGFGASVAGTPNSPRIAGTVVVAGGRYRSFEVNGNAGFAFAGGTLRVSDAAVALGPLFIGASGTVRNLLNQGTFAPHYDLATELHSSDVSALLAAVQPRAAPFFQASVDAKLAVNGTGMRPAFAGTLSAPEGAVNGLSFRDFYGGVRGDTSALSLMGGRVTVGSTNVALSGRTTERLDANVDVRAPQADLADFNDLFDRGDTFAGTGHLGLSATTRGMQIISSNGEASFAGARFRRIAFRQRRGELAPQRRLDHDDVEFRRAGRKRTRLRERSAGSEGDRYARNGERDRSRHLAADARLQRAGNWAASTHKRASPDAIPTSR